MGVPDCLSEKRKEGTCMDWTSLFDETTLHRGFGYFCADAKDFRPEAPVFNRTVTLKDSYKPGA